MEQRQILLGLLLLAILYFVFIHNTEKMENVSTPIAQSEMTSQPMTSDIIPPAVEAIQVLATSAMTPSAASPSEVLPLANTAISTMTSQSGVGAVQMLAQQSLSPVPAPAEQVQMAVNVAMDALMNPAPMDSQMSSPVQTEMSASSVPFQSGTMGSMSMPTPTLVQSVPILPVPAPESGTMGSMMMSSPASIIEAFTQVTPAAEEKPQTIFGVRNPFTGLRCYDENLPIVSVDANTFTCISKDGQNCLTRDELLIPKTSEIKDGKVVKSLVLCRNRDNRHITNWAPGKPYNVGDVAIFQGIRYLVINNIPSDKSQMPPPQKDVETFWKKIDDINTYLVKDGLRQLPGGPSNPNTRDVFIDLDQNGYYTVECTLNGLNDPNHWCNKVYSSVDNMCNSIINPDGSPDIFTKSSIPECSGTLQTYKDSWKSLVPPEIPGPPQFKSTLWKRPAQNAVRDENYVPGALEISECKNKTCMRARLTGDALQACYANCEKCGKSTCGGETVQVLTMQAPAPVPAPAPTSISPAPVAPARVVIARPAPAPAPPRVVVARPPPPPRTRPARR
jgi:hypothetical protein